MRTGLRAQKASQDQDPGTRNCYHQRSLTEEALSTEQHVLDRVTEVTNPRTFHVCSDFTAAFADRTVTVNVAFVKSYRMIRATKHTIIGRKVQAEGSTKTETTSRRVADRGAPRKVRGRRAVHLIRELTRCTECRLTVAVEFRACLGRGVARRNGSRASNGTTVDVVTIVARGCMSEKRVLIMICTFELVDQEVRRDTSTSACVRLRTRQL